MVEEFGFGLVDGLSGSGVDCELGFGWAFRVIGQGDVGRVEVGHFGVAGHAMVGELGFGFGSPWVQGGQAVVRAFGFALDAVGLTQAVRKKSGRGNIGRGRIGRGIRDLKRRGGSTNQS